MTFLYDLRELNGKKGFVFAPFHVSEEHPIILFEASDEILDENGHLFPLPLLPSTFKAPLFEEQSTYAPVPESYARRFQRFSDALRAGMFEKLVLSRAESMSCREDFFFPDLFYDTSILYANSYIYTFYIPGRMLWAGATPEVLLSSKDGNVWNTVALAGTQSLCAGGELPLKWDEKNRQEQAYVADYIRKQLSSLGIRAEESEPYAVRAGALSHLKTDFHFTLADKEHLGDLIKTLYPTPAVCGLPKEEAYRFIVENEGYDRSYYSGIVGWLDPNGQTDLYVNLRCAEVHTLADKSLGATLYAGGGLLASSNLDDEWLETEKKMQTMRRVVGSTGDTKR
ncbi:MAG: isochorismate synthase [Mediterranea sp.]|nr:isochorismate synthase [Mediterranea sp.]